MANRHVKRGLTSLIVRKMQFKTKVRYEFTSVRMAIIKKTTNNKCWQEYGEKGTLIYCWCHHYRRWYGDASKKLKIKLTI